MRLRLEQRSCRLLVLLQQVAAAQLSRHHSSHRVKEPLQLEQMEEQCSKERIG